MRHEDKVFLSEEDMLKQVPQISDWERIGKPHMWIPVAAEGDIVVQADVAYGAFRTMQNEKELHRGKDFTYANNLLYVGNSYGELKGLYRKVR